MIKNKSNKKQQVPDEVFEMFLNDPVGKEVIENLAKREQTKELLKNKELREILIIIVHLRQNYNELKYKEKRNDPEFQIIYDFVKKSFRNRKPHPGLINIYNKNVEKAFRHINSLKDKNYKELINNKNYLKIKNFEKSGNKNALEKANNIRYKSLYDKSGNIRKQLLQKNIKNLLFIEGFLKHPNNQHFFISLIGISTYPVD